MANEIKNIYPKRGYVYSLKDILEVLTLRDSPSLLFWHNGVECVIQDSHCLPDDMLAIPDFADSNWRFVETTDEDIPVFRFVADKDDITKYVEIEREIDYYTGEETENEAYFVIPKGTVRAQDYYYAHKDEYEAKYGKPFPVVE